MGDIPRTPEEGLLMFAQEKPQPTTLTEGLGLMDMWDGLKASVAGGAEELVRGTVGHMMGNWYNTLSDTASQDIVDYDKTKGVAPSLFSNIDTGVAVVIKGLVDASLSPMETADAIASLVSGIAQHSVGGDWNEESKQMASQLGAMYADRYGSLEGFKKALAEQPVEVIIDLFAAGLLTKLAAARTLSKMTGMEMGQAVERVSDKLIEASSVGMIKEGGRLGIFAGADRASGLGGKLITAKKLSETNMTKKAIWKETGFTQNQAGDWIWEINDSGMRIKDIQHLNKGIDTELFLKDVIHHPELFEAYPELQYLPIKPFDVSLHKSNMFGYYTPARTVEESAINMRPDFDSAYENKKIDGEWVQVPAEKPEIPHQLYRQRLIHEINHAVQTRSSLPSGSSPRVEMQYIEQDKGLMSQIMEKLPDAYKREPYLSDLADENYFKVQGEQASFEAQDRTNMTALERLDNLPKSVLDPDAIIRRDSFTIKNDYNYGLLGKERPPLEMGLLNQTVQMSSESLPSTGLLNGRIISQMDIELQDQHQILINEVVGTFIEDAVGMKKISAINAPSSYQGNVGVSRQTKYALELGADGKVTPEYQQKIKQASAMLGFITDQDAVTAHYMVPPKNIAESNLADISVGRILTNDEMLTAQKIVDDAGLELALISADDGLHISNYAGVDHDTFRSISVKIGESLGAEFVDYANNPLVHDGYTGGFNYVEGQEEYAKIAGTFNDAGESGLPQPWGRYADDVQALQAKARKVTEGFVKENPPSKRTNRQIGEALDSLSLSEGRTIALNDFSPKAQTTMSSRIYDDVVAVLEGGDKSALGWYGVKFQQALDDLSRIFPELKTDQIARDLYTTFTAFTSNGVELGLNIEFANAVYSSWKKTNKVNTHIPFAPRSDNFKKNLDLFQNLINEKGLSGAFEWMKKTRSVREIEASTGYKVSGYERDAILPNSVIFGSKLGVFWSNLVGMPSHLTMDMHWSRMFNKHRGQMTTQPSKASIDRFKKLLGRPNAQHKTVVKEATRIAKAYAKRNWKDGTEIERAANNIYKPLKGLRDAPTGARDRAFQTRVTKNGYGKFGVNDIQATQWYGQKRFMREMGNPTAMNTIDYSDVTSGLLGTKPTTQSSGLLGLPFKDL